MSKRTPLVALAATLATLAIAGCGAAPGSTEGGSSSDNPAAAAAAQGLGIDLAACPGDVTTVFGPQEKVGLTLPLTGGPASAFATLGPGALAAFEQANATADLPTKFELVQKDDQFQPDKTLAAAQGLIQQDGVVGFSGVTGTANALAIRDLLKEDCIPALGLPAGGTVINDPAYPGIVQTTVPFTLDARVWVEDVNRRFPDGTGIATFIGNTESGKDYTADIAKWMERTGSKSRIVATESIEATDAAAPSSAITTMRNSGAQVLFAAPTGAQCVSMMTEMANQGWKPITYLTTNCASTAFFSAAGPAGEGVLTVQAFKDVNSPRFKNDPDVQAVRAAMEKYSPSADPDNTTAYGGFTYASVFLEAAREAAKSDLGLSRLGLIVAGRHLDFHPPMFIDGVDFTTDGLEDMVPVEAGELNPWSVAEGGFVQGTLYDFEGQLTD
ncbi:ABC transporter substrate-binding protein [Pseudonocardia pini]|uniref:ABC transporter substrate-binding protein n=1 Tax=Pseudonocardia pini TaxID=2758030 RepID=UPI0015EFFCA0|nr:ABC transporter substrate-binding protein [Pseudonocardia pini]